MTTLFSEECFIVEIIDLVCKIVIVDDELSTNNKIFVICRNKWLNINE